MGKDSAYITHLKQSSVSVLMYVFIVNVTKVFLACFTFHTSFTLMHIVLVNY